MSFQESQITLIDDTEEVIKFLEVCHQRKWLSDDAMHCRLTACNKLFSVLDGDERNAEYVLKNLDKLVGRYSAKNKQIRESTLKVYKSRLKSSIEEFLGWIQDPTAWEHTRKKRNPFKVRPGESEPKLKAARKRETVRQSLKPPAKTISHPLEDRSPRLPLSSPTLPSSKARRLSFPLRRDFDVELVLPADGLKASELVRLALFLYPYCKDLDPILFPKPTLN